MELQVTITRTDDGANTHVKSRNGEASKDYASWSDALDEASSIGLINSFGNLGGWVGPTAQCASGRPHLWVRLRWIEQTDARVHS